MLFLVGIQFIHAACPPGCSNSELNTNFIERQKSYEIFRLILQKSLEGPMQCIKTFDKGNSSFSGNHATPNCVPCA